MKKLLVLMLVFELASTANATLFLYIDNSPALESYLCPFPEEITIQIYSSDDSPWLGYVIVEEGGVGDWSNPYMETTVGPGYAGDLGYITPYTEEGWGSGYEMQADWMSVPPQAGIQFTMELDLSGLTLGDTCKVSLWKDPDYDNSEDFTVFICWPEPCTILLLGLGAVMIRRKRC